MRLLKHEMRQGLISLAIWTGSIAFLMVICIILFPEMKGQMEDVSDVFASMGRFTAAFGMDRLSFGTLTGFYAIECGNILGLGGAFYAALTGITALAKEEKEPNRMMLLRKETSEVSKSDRIPSHSCLWVFHRESHL